MAVYSVFLDIDDTLISMEKGGPFPDDMAGIMYAWQRGTKFFICTGRSLVQIHPVLMQAPWRDGIVAAGGAHVIVGDKPIYHNWIPVPVLCETAGIFLEAGLECNFRADKNIYSVNQQNQNEEKLPITSKNDFMEKYPDAKVSMLTVDLKIGKKERSFLEQYFDIYPQIPHFDCFIKGEGKAKGMKMILDKLGLDARYSVAIGDSANDIDIFEAAGTGIAVGNACRELKEKASWISAPVGEGAIVRALEHLGLCRAANKGAAKNPDPAGSDRDSAVLSNNPD